MKLRNIFLGTANFAAILMAFVFTGCDKPQLSSDRNDNTPESEKPGIVQTSADRDAEPKPSKKKNPVSAPPSIEKTAVETEKEMPKEVAVEPTPPPAPVEAETEKVDSPLPLNIFPVKRELTSIDGRTINAVLIKRIDDNVILKLSDDGKEFSVPISTLVEDDRFYCMRLPKTKEFKRIDSVPEGEDKYVTLRRKQIAELKRKRQELVAKKMKETNQILIRTLQREIGLADKEREKLAEEIDEFKDQQ